MVVRMGARWRLPQGRETEPIWGWRAPICFSVFAFDTSTWICPTESWVTRLIWKLRGECGVSRGHGAKDLEGFRKKGTINSVM